MVRHSDHMGIMWDTLWPHGHYVGYTLTTRAIHTETYRPCRQHRLIHHIVRHDDHMDTIWDTLWPHGIHSDHMGNTYWPCRQHRLIHHMARHSDHAGNIWWHSDHRNIWQRSDHRNIWWHSDHMGRYMGYNLTTPIYGETLWPLGQHMVRHSDHSGNIWWDTLTTWAIYTETYWLCGQYIPII